MSDTRRAIQRIECGLDPNVRISAIKMEIEDLRRERRNLQRLMRTEARWKLKERIREWIRQFFKKNKKIPAPTPIPSMEVDLVNGKIIEVRTSRGPSYTYRP